MNQLAFPSALLRDLRRDLLSAAPNEAAAIVLGGFARRGPDVRFLAREVFPVPAEAYLAQQEYRVEIAPTFIAPLLKRARIAGWALLLVHTHPFADEARFSPVDDAGEARLLPSIFSRAPDRPHGSLVLTESRFDARFYASPESSSVGFDRLVGCGPHVTIETRLPTAAKIDPVFDRSVRAFGEAGQLALAASSAAVVGVGGIGSLVAQELAHLGVGRLILIDDDTVEVTNLNRVVGSTAADVGRTKVAVAADAVTRIRPSVAVRPECGSVLFAQTALALLEADIIFCCTDTHGSRAILNQFSYQYLIPVIDVGVRIDLAANGTALPTGRVQMLAAGLPCLACQNTLDPDEVRRDLMTDEERQRDPYIVGVQEPQPAVISLNGTMASLAVTMMLSALIGFPSKARHQIYQGAYGSIRPITSDQLPNCVICSLDGALARGGLWSMPWRQD